MMRHVYYCLLILLLRTESPAQELVNIDPCGYPDTTSLEFLRAASGNWGYGYDTLLYDIGEWKKSPFAAVDSVGASVQNRTMFVLTIQDTTVDSLHLRRRIWIHARTHPAEVQGTWVTNEMIKALLADDSLARSMRGRYIFNIMPMYNPDGVELGKSRENANNIDLESNWNAASPQKEVQVLRSQFITNMAQPNPMEMMLNMHSAFDCTRYFVYHAPGGTSPRFAVLEQRFINYVRSFFPGAIKPYTYFVSWTNAPATQYPESWCWANYKEKIMAMTYEDGNCAAAEKFDSTALALLKGIDAFLQDTTEITSVLAANNLPSEFLLEQNYPNPFNPSTTIGFRIQEAGHVVLKVYDVLGREAATLVDDTMQPGRYTVEFDGSAHSSGIYLYRLVSGHSAAMRKMILMK